ncbi:MAG: CRTAC1 family protein [Myxococcota bacterium]
MQRDWRWMGLWGLWACGSTVEPLNVEEISTFECLAPTELGFDTTFLEGDAAASHRFAGAGIGVGDVDGDDRLDLVVPGPERLSVYLQSGPLSEPTFAALELPDELAALGGEASATALADVDRDGDLDVWITRFGPPDALLINQGQAQFIATTDPLVAVPHHGQGAAFADLNRDGRLDIIVAGHLAVRAGDDGRTAIEGPADPTRILLQGPANPGQLGPFEDHTADLPEGAHAAYTFVATPTHLDNDGQLDLLLANDFPIYRPNLALRQQPDGTFDLSPDSGLHIAAAGMGVAAHDVNGDGWDDFVMPVWNRLVYARSVDGAAPRWIEAQAAAGLLAGGADPAWVGWGADFADLDADGIADLLVAFGHLDTVGPFSPRGTSALNALEQPDQTYQGQADGTFALIDWGLGHRGASRGILAVDLNRDGWLDVVRRDLEGPIRVDWARCGPNHTLVVELAPSYEAIGAVITVLHPDGTELRRTIRAGGTSLGSAGPAEAHFGLGEATEVQSLTVQWPDGTTDALARSISADRRIRLQRALP